MRMVVGDSISHGGDGRANEDRVGWSHDSAWVIDGATPVTPSFLDEISDARWLAEQVDDILREMTPLGTMEPSEIFRRIAVEVGRRMSALGFPDTALPPACSLGLVSLTARGLVFSFVGDIYLYDGSDGQIIQNPKFGQKERAAVRKQTGPQSKWLREGSLGIAERRRQYIDGPGDMFVLSNNERVARGVVSHVSASDGSSYLMMSDGFARAVEPYGVFDTYADLHAYVDRQGLGAALSRIRQHEKDAAKFGRQHFKAADDASAIMFSVVK